MAPLRKFFKLQKHFVASPPHFHIEGGGEGNNFQKRTILRSFKATLFRTKSRLKKQKNIFI